MYILLYKLTNLLYVFLIFTYLSTEDKEAGADRALSVSLLIVVTGADVDWPVGTSSISSGQPKASFVLPYLNKKIGIKSKKQIISTY